MVIAVALASLPAQANAQPRPPLTKSMTQALAAAGVGDDVKVTTTSEKTIVFLEVDDIDIEQTNRFIEEFQARNDRLSDAFKDEFNRWEEQLPGDPPAQWIDFDGELVAEPTGISLRVPTEYVTPNASFWQQFLATATGILVMLLARTSCYAFFEVGAPLAGPVCAGVGAFLGAFVAKFILMVIDHRLGDPKAWGEAFAVGILAAAGAVGWEAGLGGWAKTQARPLFVKISDAIRGWWKDAADFLQNMTNSMVDRLIELARSRGWEVARTLRPMGLGSSSTYGEGSSDGNGYRDSADQGFQRLISQRRLSGASGAQVTGAKDDTPLVDWVGSVQVGTMADREIEGWGGYTIDLIADKAKCAVKTYQPNLITLMAGGNDVIQNATDGAIDRLERLIRQVSADAPGVTVLVAGTQPFRDAARRARGNAFTAQIPAMVNRLVGSGLRVVYADISGLQDGDVGWDGVHANDQGYDKIAAAFVQAAGTAMSRGWVYTPNPQASDEWSNPCGLRDDGRGKPVPGPAPNKLGEGWDDAGVINWTEYPSTNRFWVVDINKDRKAEFVTVYPDQTFRFWWNSGPSGEGWMPFVEGNNSYRPPGGSVGNMLRFADLDGDGFPDCAVVHLNGNIDAYTWKADAPSGQRMCKQKYDGIAGVHAKDGPVKIVPPTRIRFADITGGGRDDYLLIEPDGTTTAWYNRGFQFQRPTRYWLDWADPVKIANALKFPREIRYADINGDDRADRLLITPSGGARAWINEGVKGGGGTYRDIGRITADPGLPPKDIQLADMDGDGKDDFLRIGWTGVTHLWLNRLPPSYFKTFHP
ncbi:FG-GAP-like repeat-containing protein [Spongiactinospora rosea]|nr:FG-GAP-like repeat-containing protein [Spongiactinospora rosea]